MGPVPKKQEELITTAELVQKPQESQVDRDMADPTEQYRMDHGRRGLAVIFTQEHFWQLMLPERRGTNADRDNLARRFSELGFEVRCFNNLKAAELLDRIHEGPGWASHLEVCAVRTPPVTAQQEGKRALHVVEKLPVPGLPLLGFGRSLLPATFPH
ncbi:Caspase-6 [Fukomys damarensis]|uniref:Caspase-6 n=1 Tax=Fukomys damarensis TaxID=885580 RepID=A0A091D6I2_FUKDA|nr:Caspase-6 [Fukomys damarensis]